MNRPRKSALANLERQAKIHRLLIAFCRARRSFALTTLRRPMAFGAFSGNPIEPRYGYERDGSWDGQACSVQKTVCQRASRA